MSHEQMYSPEDPNYQRVRAICLKFPESTEVEAWGRPTFRAGKRIFAVYGAVYSEDDALIFKPDPSDVEALKQDSRFFTPPYFVKWLALNLAANAPDWQEVTELLELSYRQVALVRMRKALDERSLS